MSLSIFSLLPRNKQIHRYTFAGPYFSYLLVRQPPYYTVILLAVVIIHHLRHGHHHHHRHYRQESQYRKEMIDSLLTNYYCFQSVKYCQSYVHQSIDIPLVFFISFFLLLPSFTAGLIHSYQDDEFAQAKVLIVNYLSEDIKELYLLTYFCSKDRRKFCQVLLQLRQYSMSSVTEPNIEYSCNWQQEYQVGGVVGVVIAVA